MAGRHDLRGRGRRLAARRALHPAHQVGIVEKLWSSKGSLTEGRIVALAARRASRPTSCAAACTVLFPLAVPRPPRAAGRRSPRARSATCTRATASRCPPTQTLGGVIAVQQLPGRARVPDRRRAARPPARDPARGRLRAQPGAVRGHRRGPRLPGPVHESEPASTTAVGRRSCGEIDGFSPVVIGPAGRRVAGEASPRRRSGRDPLRRPTRSAIVTVHDGPPIESGEIIAPGGARGAGQPTTTTTSRIRRRSSRSAGGGASSSRCSPTAPSSSTAGSPRWRSSPRR